MKLLFDKWRLKNGSAAAGKDSWVVDRKPVLRCGAICVVGFTTVVQVWKTKLIIMTTFLSSKCSRSRVMIKHDDPFTAAYTKIHDAYTNPEKATAFGSQKNLVRATNCPLKHVNLYLNSSETYTKYKLARKRFLRLEVISYQLNEVWPTDLTDMQQLAKEKWESGIFL